MYAVRGAARLKRPAYAFPGALAVALATWWLVPSPRPTATILAVTAFSIVLWVTNPVPPSYTSLIAIGLLGVAFSPDLALVGFRSPATWLIGFGLFVGEATRRSGLAGGVGRWITARTVPADASARPRRAYASLLVGLCLGGTALALLVPSTIVRVLILAPVLREAGAQFDSEAARTGLLLGPLFATFYGAAGILTAALPNIIITGIVESIGGPAISWTEWALVLFVPMSLGRTLLVAGVVYYLYRPDPDADVSVTGGAPGLSSPGSRRMLAFLLVGVAVWTTDFVHHLHPVFGALLVVILALAPGVGVVGFDAVAEDVDYSILFFLGAVFAIGEGLTRTGFADAAAAGLLDALPTGGPLFVLLFVVFVATILLSLLVEGLVVASVLTPVLVSFAAASGAPVVPVVMTEAIALSTYFFPYQSAVLVTMLAQGDAGTNDLVRTATACTLATVLVLLPVQLAVFALVY